MRFPIIVTRDLEGRRYEVPGDLPVGPRVLVIAFQRWHTSQVDTWAPALDRIVETHPGATWWEIPALSRVYTPMRPYIDGGMRAGIPDPVSRRKTLTSYTDLKSLGTALGLKGFDNVAVVLVDADSEVLWQGTGDRDDGAEAGLVAALETVCPGATAGGPA